MTFIWKFIRGFLVLIGLMVVALAVVGAVALRKEDKKLPDKIVLAYTFYGTPKDAPAGPAWLSHFVPEDPTLSEVTDAIYNAAKDPRVTAFAAQLSGGDYNWADVQALRTAIAAFKASGKKTYVFSESYGELYPGMAEYYLASAFDDIWLQPVGTVAITGFQAEVPYFKKTLDLIGVTPDIIQKGDHKTAPEPALLEHMSEAQRETLHGILASMMTDFFEGVSAGRKIPSERIGQLIDGAPYTADEARERKLVDHVGYVDQLTTQLVPDRDDKKLGFVNAADYLSASHGSTLDQVVREEKQITEKNTKKNTVALVYVSGLIVSDDGQGGGLMSDRMAYAQDIGDAIMDAAEDDDIKAVVLRVDSPGGSPSASETIRRAVSVARAKGKYVVVSMGSEAASGGYWIVVDANKIYAEPGTLTGSIGVFGGKASFAGLWEKAGVNWESVSLGGNAGIWSSNAPYTDEQRASVSRMLDDVYESFIDRVAKGRHFAPEVVEPMAGGRVWTGRQAKERGLIDELGGLRQALEDVAKNMGVDDVRKLHVLVMPDKPTAFDDIMNLMAGGAESLDFIKQFTGVMAAAQHPAWSVTRAPLFEIRH